MYRNWIFAAGVALIAAPVLADQVVIGSSARATLFRNQLRVLDARAAEQDRASVSLSQPRIYIPGTPDAALADSAYSGPYLEPALSAAERHHVPPDLFVRLVQVESGWNPAAISPKGAIGLAQIMPQTARRLGIDPRNPLQNLDGGARYLRQMYERFGSWPLAVAAYNSGPEAVVQYGGIPPYDETQAYVKAIFVE